MESSAIGPFDAQAVNTIRFLAVDMVEAAKSGHPGAPLGQAPMAYALWSRRLHFDPGAPSWWNRDRFVLSCGHASALLYSLLHLFGYDLPLTELKRFRQIDSKTPGHPEHGHTAGVETTTGPLGQGFGNAVGMAIAREMLAVRFNRPGFALFDYAVWAVASDGDLMEGVASEAASLAGHLGLGSLNVLYDDNDISIDGPTSLSFGEDVAARFAAYGWHVLRVADGNDLGALLRAMDEAAAVTDRPSLIAVKTVIGFGSPHKQGTSEAHGEPLGAAEAQATKAALGWPAEPAFHVPDEVRPAFAAAVARGTEAHRRWNDLWVAYSAGYPEEAAELERRFSHRLPEGWIEALPQFGPADAMASREASGKVITALAPLLPELVGSVVGRKGPYFADEGDFASAGAVNVQYLDKLDKGLFSATGGSFGHGRAFGAKSWDYNGGVVLGALETSLYSGPWTRPDEVRKINALLRWSRGTQEDGLSLTGMAYANRWYSTDQIPERAEYGGIIPLWGNVDRTDGGDTTRFSLSGRWSQVEGNHSSRVEAYAIRSTLDLYNNFDYFLTQPDLGDQFRQFDRRTVVGLNAQHAIKYDVGLFPVETRFGFQGRYDNIRLGLQDTWRRQPYDALTNDQVAEGSVGFWTDTTVRWTPWLRTTGGVRADYFHADLQSLQDLASAPKVLDGNGNITETRSTVNIQTGAPAAPPCL